MTKDQFVSLITDDLNSGIPSTDTDRYNRQDVAYAISLVYSTVLNRLKAQGVSTANLLSEYEVEIDSDGYAPIPVNYIQLTDGFEIAFGEDCNQTQVVYPRQSRMARLVMNDLPASRGLITLTPMKGLIKFDNLPTEVEKATIYLYTQFADLDWDSEFNPPAAGEEMIRAMVKESLAIRDAKPIDNVNDEV